MSKPNTIADQFCNIALMISLRELEKQAWAAFDSDDHQAVEHTGKIWDVLISEIHAYIPAEQV